METITRTKKELSFVSKKLEGRKRVGGKENTTDNSQSLGAQDEEIERSLKIIETIGDEKRHLEQENHDLKRKIQMFE
jgi:K+/H+ antiporter YhaU regulatory subunit KhtT